MEKIPYIECTPELWEYIEPYLKEWGYSIFVGSNFNRYPYLVINAMGILGECRSYSASSVGDYNRILLTNVEEFLERAAELKGFTYKRKSRKFHGVDIKPGMVLVSNTGILYIVFPANGYLATVSYNEDTASYSCWDTLEHTLLSGSINKVLDAPRNRITDGKILWEKPKEVVITMDEIAEKFGYKVERIQIKK